jgi:uncharacterized protein YecE (DUF72 family)
LYYSKYSQQQRAAFAAAVIEAKAAKTWCIFDNTARHAAWDDALQFIELLRAQHRSVSAVDVLPDPEDHD